jgi:hypothetical protein
MRLRLGISVLAVAVLAAGTATAGVQRTLNPNPANDPALIGKRLDPNRYDGAGRCVRRVPKGTRRLKRWMRRHTKRRVPSGTIRCDGGVHGTGRALDFGLDARKKRQKRLAMRVINTWLARDARGRRNALARRMGVQLVIFNCRWWQAGDRGMSRYSACAGGRKNADPTQGHIDHMHIELTKPAAKLKTTYWKTTLEGGGSGGKTGGVGLAR